MHAITEAPLDTLRACQQALAGAVVVARNGHVAAPPDSASPAYHYHVTAGYPYFTGGYRGTAGTVRQ